MDFSRYVQKDYPENFGNHWNGNAVLKNTQICVPADTWYTDPTCSSPGWYNRFGRHKMLNLETFGEDELYLTVEADMDGYVDKENCDINRSFLNYWFVYPKLNIDTIYEFLRAWADIAAMKWGYDNKSDWLDSSEYELMDKR